MTDPFRQDMEDFDGEYPDSWRPNVGDVLIGEVVRYSEGYAAHGTYPICVMREEKTGTLWSVWLMHTVLLEEFKEQRPEPGERVGIKRLPDSKKGYKRYHVNVDRKGKSAIPDFEKYAKPGDVAPEDMAEARHAGERGSFADESQPDTDYGAEDDLPF